MSLRKKLEALEAALGSPGDTAAGLARRLIKESPAPSLLCSTPKLSTPTGQTQEIDLDTSADLFVTPKPSSSPGPSKKRPRHTDQQKTSNGFRMPTAVGKPTGLSAVSKESFRKHTVSVTGPLRTITHSTDSNIGPSSSLLKIINKSSATRVGSGIGKHIPFGVPVSFSNSSVFREGYNGLGGHEKVIIPPAKIHPTGQKKLLLGGPIKQMFGPSKTAKSPLPPLPSLNDTIDLEN